MDPNANVVLTADELRNLSIQEICARLNFHPVSIEEGEAEITLTDSDMESWVLVEFL